MLGDGLMAVFGAPMLLVDPCKSAVEAAVEMNAMMAQFSAERVAQGKAPIRIGIGIATGHIVAGYTGTQDRATYTCIGDTVNLAARLEQHTKVTGSATLLDAATRAALGNDFAIEGFGPVTFRGKAAPVEVYGLGRG